MKMNSIIFDLDGTLWDSSSSVIDSWNKTLDKYDEVKNRLTVDDMKGVMGLVISDIAKIFFPYLEVDKRLEIMKNCCKNECEYLAKHGAILYDKLEETLEELSKNHNLFIVSNCQCGYIESFFESHKLNKYFIDYENSGRTGLTKGENIKLIIERNNLSNSVYVGDTEGDLNAARFAGIPFIYARYGFGQVKEYDYVIDSFDELLKLI
ncbi:HAD family hydrolase [Clostridium sp. OS1-26]|uniref:HAD family hydrolase n=1 Tax=Clostridium sp. OS1-26 TaxID=3070681 RepID=UPI0027E0D6EF|nr:HAD family hydrolase [Clostridium sp. OS1-26]WML33226.1 HAD family hydrolase [Clostridium sp. OS1-26]